MNTKLTLTIEESLIDLAKKYAKKEGRSLSAIIENYLKMVTKEKSAFEIKESPIVDSLKGSFKLPDDFNYKNELQDALSEKYLK